ncbi:MAG TPA: glycosyltransferase family 39 protein [Streptosporangiaceae bacterium]|nr:glycosyltransferase family 39 protein [Streptosporangiaceae bacterium]
MRGLQSDAAAPERPGTAGVEDKRAAGRRWLDWLVVTLPALLELVVGGYRISGPSFWRDEGYTITGSQRPVGAIFALVQHEDAFHGLYLLMMHPIIALFGRSEIALRVPSLIAMSVTVGLTSALGMRLARAIGLSPAPVVGLLAGLLLTALPVTTRYAQEGRPYALVMLFAVFTTYILVVAVARGRWRWWALYGAGLLLTSLFDLAAVLLAGTHGISLLLARRGGRHDDVPAAAQDDEPAFARVSVQPANAVAPGVPRRWLAACAAAAIVISPVIVLSARESAQLDWVQPPNFDAVFGLLQDCAGASSLIVVAAVLATLGSFTGGGLRRGRGLTLSVICLPWFVLPPALLLTVSLLHPLYVERYILFCVPGLVILESAGLVWLVKLTRRFASRWSTRRATVLSFVPSAAIAVLIVIMVLGPQAWIRRPDDRADDLRTIARVLATHERPGDAILYLPRKTAVIGTAYRDGFGKLRDIGLQTSPVVSGTLLGTAAVPRVVAARLRRVRRVWVVEWVHPLAPDSAPPPDLLRLLTPARMGGSWLIRSVLLVLYRMPSS